MAMLTRIRALLILFALGLLISGITAFPIEWEASVLKRVMLDTGFARSIWPAMADWIAFVYQGIVETYQAYPFMAYGTDWLAFAHIVIAVAFWGPIRDPIRNIWVIEFGMIACVLVLPLALFVGPLRGIPFFWQVIDCSFGVFGIIPLWIAHGYIRQLLPSQAQVGPSATTAN